jgi:hypothetical protein
VDGRLRRVADRRTAVRDAPVGSPDAPPPGRLRALRAPLALLAVIAVAVGVWSGWELTHRGPQPLLQLGFRDARALVTNELAHTHADTPGVHVSKDWIVTSGSLFSDQGTGWTGPIDARTPDVDSRRSTNSAVLRAVTRRADLDDVVVSLDLDVAGLEVPPGTERHDYDGVHVMLRYTSPQNLYYVSVCRRDGTAVIKKKDLSTPSDDEGTYVTLATAPFPCPMRTWTSTQVEVRTTPSGVRLTFWSDGRKVVSALDDGRNGSPPLRQPGRVGIRGDNAEFHFRDFTVLDADR